MWPTAGDVVEFTTGLPTAPDARWYRAVAKGSPVPLADGRLVVPLEWVAEAFGREHRIPQKLISLGASVALDHLRPPQTTD